MGWRGTQQGYRTRARLSAWALRIIFSQEAISVSVARRLLTHPNEYLHEMV